MNKIELRQKILEERKNLSEDYVKTYSEKLTPLLWQLIQEQNTKIIHTYLPINKEVDTFPLVRKCLANQLTVVVSKTEKNRQLKHYILEDVNDLVEGKFGTLYPKHEKEFKGNYDLILIPGVAFDKQKNRLGYGGGYYDTFLQYQGKSTKIGLAYPFQILDQIETQAHDIAMDLVLYEE